MRVAFLYNEASEDPAQFAEDDDPSRSPVVAALQRLGYEVTPIACTLDFADVHRQLEQLDADVAFNRVESLGGSDAMSAAIPMLLDTMQIAHTGCSTESIVATANKIGAKQSLLRAGLPTPEWIEVDDRTSERASRGVLTTDCRMPVEVFGKSPRFILKSIFEHASFEMDDTSVVRAGSVEELSELIRDRSLATGKPFFAERFVDGREFNLSLLGETPDVLPPAEIDFSAFPVEKPRIVGFGAEWRDGSFEFQNTPRRFEFPAVDTPLIRRLMDLALECGRLFGLNGYARVDFRVDAAGQPWILEVNTNPCIAPTSGFAAALEQAGLSYDDGIQRIVEAALSRGNLTTAANRPAVSAR